MKNMSGKKIALISIFSVLGMIIILMIGSYNSLVKKREAVSGQSSNIETQLQRRLDLIPKLVNTVKGYVKHESGVIAQVSDARSKLAGAGGMRDKAAADAEVSSAVSRLLAITENYPDLKANAQFTQLSDELAGTENRIAVARKDYNQATENYNNSITTFPAAIIANMFGFSLVDYFKSDSSAKNAPDVSFD
ncbi:MAG: LemA family protein [Oscillospiraceae bacterium]|jgi:LemA protein|nr:LemA family protein [Oscillospiraceae bacterium]